MTSAFRCDDGVWWWTEDKARPQSASQLGTSACGPTALLDVLKLLVADQPVTSQTVLNVCPARVRDYDAPLLEYLESRAKAGTTHVDLVTAAEQLSAGRVTGRLCLVAPLLSGAQWCAWLAAWMEAGAVPMLTMNLFLKGGDAWHHQIVHGVQPQSCSRPAQVCLLNPISRASPERLLTLLASPSFMIIPRDHVERRVFDSLEHLPATTCADGLSISPRSGAALASALQGLHQLATRLDTAAGWQNYQTGTQLTHIVADVLHAITGGGKTSVWMACTSHHAMLTPQVAVRRHDPRLVASPVDAIALMGW